MVWLEVFGIGAYEQVSLPRCSLRDRTFNARNRLAFGDHFGQLGLSLRAQSCHCGHDPQSMVRVALSEGMDPGSSPG